LKVPTMYPLGMSWANCFRTHNSLTMYPLGILPFAPSASTNEGDRGKLFGETDYLLNQLVTFKERPWGRRWRFSRYARFG